MGHTGYCEVCIIHASLDMRTPSVNSKDEIFIMSPFENFITEDGYVENMTREFGIKERGRCVETHLTSFGLEVGAPGRCNEQSGP